MVNCIDPKTHDKREAISKLLIFSVNGCICAINADLICKVTELSNISPLQQAEPYIIGLTKEDGEIYPVADLRLFFGADKETVSASNLAILLENGKSKVYVVIDDIIEFVENDVKPSACLLNKNPCISGIIQNGDRNIILLSSENVLSALKV